MAFLLRLNSILPFVFISVFNTNICFSADLAPTECSGNFLQESLNGCVEIHQNFIDCLHTSSSSCKCYMTNLAIQNCMEVVGCNIKMFIQCEDDETTRSVQWKPASIPAYEWKKDQPYSPTVRALTYPNKKPPLKNIQGIHVINLKRRPERLDFFLNSSKFKSDEIHIFEAVDAQNLRLNEEIKHVFNHWPDFLRYNRGQIGVFASHYSLWKLIASTKNEQHMIFEDDAIFSENFIEEWNTKYGPAFLRESTLTYLSGVLDSNFWAYKHGNFVLDPVNEYYNKHKPSMYFSHTPSESDILAHGFKGNEPTRQFFYTGMTYILSSEGAKKLVQFIATKGIRREVDHTLKLLMHWTESVYATQPLLVRLPSHSGVNFKKTDVTFKNKTPMLQDEPEILDDSEQCADKDILIGLGRKKCVFEYSNKYSNSEEKTPKNTNLLTIDEVQIRVPTFVISFEYFADRIKELRAAAKLAQLTYSIAPGVNGFNINITSFQEQGFISKDFPTSQRGTAAVAMSHIVLLEQLLDDKTSDFYLIMEDDILIENNFLAEVNSAIKAAPKNWQLLNFGCDANCKTNNDFVGGLFVYHNNKQIADQSCESGLRAYLVNKAGANAILEAAVPIKSAIDAQIRIANGTTLTAFCSGSTLAVHNKKVTQILPFLDNEDAKLFIKASDHRKAHERN